MNTKVIVYKNNEIVIYMRNTEGHQHKIKVDKHRVWLAYDLKTNCI